jgi:hypothetical protein
MAPDWLTTVAWFYLGVCFLCAAVIAYDIGFNRRRQAMGVMNAVYPITALYFGPFALALYRRWGRAVRHTATPSRTSRRGDAQDGDGHARHGKGSGGHGMPEYGGPHIQHDIGHGTEPHDGHEASRPIKPTKPRWATMAIEVSHCGSGCTLGDLIAEWTIFALALTIAGRALFAEYVGDYVLALAFGIVFQYFAIAPMRGLGVRDGLKAAARADFVSLTFFEIGLFGWMALTAFVFFPAPHHLMPSSAAYWFLMQTGMIVGFVTSWPANVWLVNRGIKIAI